MTLTLVVLIVSESCDSFSLQRSASVKSPKFFFRLSLRPTKVLAISMTFSFSVSLLWQLSSVRLLNRCCVIFDLSQVFRRRAAENDRSHEALLLD